jgi:thymidylate synthase
MINKADKYLKETLLEILEEGTIDKNPRPKYEDGEPAFSKFITQKVFEYDLQEGEFPIPTLRKTAIKTGIKEILWIYQKQTSSLKTARKLGINWWDNWDIGNDTVGKRYGATVAEYDIIENVLYELEHNKFSRRHVVNLYQYRDFEETKGLYPCVFLSMFAVREIDNVNYLDLMVVSRSSDFITAGFINQTQYVGLLMMIVGHLNTVTEENWEIGKFMFVVNDIHMYLSHRHTVKEVLQRESLDIQPTMSLKVNKDFFDYTIEDFEFSGLENILPLKNKLELAI